MESSTRRRRREKKSGDGKEKKESYRYLINSVTFTTDQQIKTHAGLVKHRPLKMGLDPVVSVFLQKV
jgi:hypothetical protein